MGKFLHSSLKAHNIFPIHGLAVMVKINFPIRCCAAHALWLKWLSFLNFSTVSGRFGPQHVQRYMILVRLFEKLVSQPSRSNASGV